jgi:hypothetical protein
VVLSELCWSLPSLSSQVSCGAAAGFSHRCGRARLRSGNAAMSGQSDSPGHEGRPTPPGRPQSSRQCLRPNGSARTERRPAVLTTPLPHRSPRSAPHEKSRQTTATDARTAARRAFSLTFAVTHRDAVVHVACGRPRTNVSDPLEHGRVAGRDACRSGTAAARRLLMPDARTMRHVRVFTWRAHGSRRPGRRQG